MTMNRIHGPAAWLDTETTDGRMIDSTRFTIKELPLPLLAIRRPDAGSGHSGAELAGVLRLVAVTDGVVHVEGEVEDLAPGRYGCGVDLDEIDVELKSDTLVTMAGRLVAVTLYTPESRKQPVFPDAYLTVESV